MESNRMTRILMKALLCSLLIMPVFLVPAQAKKSDERREEFRGIVTKRPPHTLMGEWVIGGRFVQTGPNTEFDQAEGPLDIGSCAKVTYRNGRVHEIDSEPLHDCK